MFKKSLLTIGLACLVALDTHAVSQLKNQLGGGTNNCVTGGTNTYVLYGDTTGSFTNGIPYGGVVGPDRYLQCDNAKDYIAQLDFVSINTGTSPSTNTFRFAGSVDAAHWTNNLTTISYICLQQTTNYVTILVPVTNAPTAVALRSLEMPTQANTTTTITNLAVRGRDKKP
jgi:hypothetical protein